MLDLTTPMTSAGCNGHAEKQFLEVDLALKILKWNTYEHLKYYEYLKILKMEIC